MLIKRWIKIDRTNRMIRICRRIEEIEELLACKDRLPKEKDELLYEKEGLEESMINLLKMR